MVAQDQGDSAEWRQQATARIEQGKSLYHEGRYYEAADAFGWVAGVDMWFMDAGSRQIMALVRAGLADPEATAALAAATTAFRTLEGFPLPDDLQAEYELIDRLLEDHANAPPQEQAQPEPPERSEPAMATPEPTVVVAPTDAPPEIPTEPTPTPGPGPGEVAEATTGEQPDTPEAMVQDEGEQPDSLEPMIQEQAPEPSPQDLPANESAGDDSEPMPDSTSSSLASGDVVSEPESPRPAEPDDSVQEEPTPPAVIPAGRSWTQVTLGDIISLAEVTTPPRLKRSELPVYPRKAQQRRVSGDVKLHVLIGIDGSVERLRFVSVPQEDLGFEEAVEDVIDKWRFEPATKNGVVVRTWVPIRIPCCD